MRTVEYHIERDTKGWKIIACFGFLDVRTIAHFGTKNAAIQGAKLHAQMHGFTPLILS